MTDHNTSKQAAHRSAFSLIELMVSVAIIGTLAAILLPTISMIMQRVQTLHCMSNQRELGMAVFGFAEENGGRAPGSAHRYTPSSASVSWVDILNKEWFAGQGSTTSRFDAGSARNRRLVCPTFRTAESTANYGRAYTYNSIVAGAGYTDGNGDPQVKTGFIVKPATKRDASYDYYHLGMKFDKMVNTSNKLLIIETERATDYFGTQWPGNVLNFGSGGYPIWSANGGMWAFRHNRRQAAVMLFCDQHVSIVHPDPELNSSTFVDPRSN